MAKGSDVLSMLIPSGGWVIIGDNFNSIIYDEKEQQPKQPCLNALALQQKKQHYYWEVTNA